MLVHRTAGIVSALINQAAAVVIMLGALDPVVVLRTATGVFGAANAFAAVVVTSLPTAARLAGGAVTGTHAALGALL
jgi:hypothetical protein